MPLQTIFNMGPSNIKVDGGGGEGICVLLLTLLPIGGLLSHTRVLAATLKPRKLWLPNFLAFFTFSPQFETILAKSIRQGVATVIFQTRGYEKLETWKFLFLLKMAEISRENNCRSEKPFLITK